MVIAITHRVFATWLLFMAAVVAQPHGDSRTTVPPRQNQGLIDFALHGINPNDRDYGRCVDEVRRVLIHETLDRAYFWSNLAAVTVTFCLFVIIVHQHRLRQHRELIAAQTLTQYRNALARAEDQVQEISRKNHALIDALVSASPIVTSIPVETSSIIGQAKPRKAPGPAPASAPTAAEVFGATGKKVPSAAEPSATRKTNASPVSDAKLATVAVEAPTANTKTVQAQLVSTGVDKPNNSQPTQVVESPAPMARRAASPEDPRNSSQMALFSSDVDLVARINTLQEQLNTSQERERHLRRQLNDSELRVQKEREKTRNLQA